MKILMVCSEMVPFAKTGGLGDMVAALTAELGRSGHDVRVVMPRYYSIDTRDLEWGGGPLGVPTRFGELWCGVYQGKLPDSEVPVYFLDHEGLFGRDGVYGTKSDPDFGDNVSRYTLLCRGAFQLCRMQGWIPDVVHAHDWPGALTTVFLNTVERSGPFENTGSVLTIHNLGYQGIYAKHHFERIGLEWQDFHGKALEYHGSLNLLQAGLRNADLLTTVSETYAAEIQTPEYGHNLDAVLRHRRADLYGVLNGMDYDLWNPETDQLLPNQFSHEDLRGKAEVKRALQQEAGLPEDPNVALIGIVSRLVEQKGFGELCGPSHGSLYKICADLAVQFVILGTGDAWCEQELARLSNQLPNLSVALTFDNRLAHLIEGGSDFFLMPSNYEPCGLNQMYSLRYGTLPIVRHTGGLADSVVNYDEATAEGTGFVFDKMTPRAIYDTVGWAVWAWYNRPDHIDIMRRRAMQQRFSWEESAQRYV